MTKLRSLTRSAFWSTSRPTGWQLARGTLAMTVLLAVVLNAASAAGVPHEPRTVMCLAVFVTYLVLRARWVLWPARCCDDPNAPLTGVLVVSLLAAVLTAGLIMLGAPENETGLIAALLGGFYALAAALRLALAESPRLFAARHYMFVLIAFSLGTAVFSALTLREPGINHAHTSAFYGTLAQVDVALLLATVFQSRWAQGVQSLEGMVALTVTALVASVGSALIVLGRGDDSFTLFFVAVLGVASGLIVVGVATAIHVAPDLREDLLRRMRSDREDA